MGRGRSVGATALSQALSEGARGWGVGKESDEEEARQSLLA